VSANSSMKSVAVGIAFAFLSAGCGACEFDYIADPRQSVFFGQTVPGNVSFSTTGLPSECCSWASQCVSAFLPTERLEPSSECMSKLANMESFVLEESFNGGICSGPVCSIASNPYASNPVSAGVASSFLATASNPYAIIRPQLNQMDFFSPMSEKCCSQWKTQGPEDLSGVSTDDLSDECRIPLFNFRNLEFKDLGSLCFRASGMVKLNPENGCFRQPFLQTLI